MRKKIGKIVFFVLLALLIYKLAGSVLEYKTAYEQQKKYIPSPMEIQTLLTEYAKDTNCPRYDPQGIDGVIGDKSKTAWSNFVNDRYASKCDWYYQEVEFVE